MDYDLFCQELFDFKWQMKPNFSNKKKVSRKRRDSRDFPNTLEISIFRFFDILQEPQMPHFNIISDTFVPNEYHIQAG